MTNIKENLDRLFKWLSRQPRWKHILLIVLLWAVIFIPLSIDNAVFKEKYHYYYFPEELSPYGGNAKEFNVEITPSRAISAVHHKYVVDVDGKKDVTFYWNMTDFQGYVGSVYLILNTSWGEKKEVWMEQESGDRKEYGNYSKTISFKENGKVYYYFRMETSDIPIFKNRARTILDGKTLYKDVWTETPPLINYLFIPATLFGETYLAFEMYFSLIALACAVIIYFIFSHFFKKDKRGKGLLVAILFIISPVTFLNPTKGHQDEIFSVLIVLAPLLAMTHNKNKTASFLIGVGIMVKVWACFMFLPLVLIRLTNNLKRVYATLITGGVVLTIMGYFYLVAGNKFLWFLRFYIGLEEGKTTSIGISMWRLFEIHLWSVPSPLLYAHLLISQILLFYWLYRSKSKDYIKSFTLSFSLFLLFYPKIHWGYYLVLFPFLAYYAVNNKRYFYLYLALVISVMTSMRFMGYLGFGNDRFPPFSELTLVSSILTNIVLIILIIYLLDEEGLINRIRSKVTNKKEKKAVF